MGNGASVGHEGGGDHEILGVPLEQQIQRKPSQAAVIQEDRHASHSKNKYLDEKNDGSNDHHDSTAAAVLKESRQNEIAAELLAGDEAAEPPEVKETIHRTTMIEPQQLQSNTIDDSAANRGGSASSSKSKATTATNKRKQTTTTANNSEDNSNSNNNNDNASRASRATTTKTSKTASKAPPPPPVPAPPSDDERDDDDEDSRSDVSGGDGKKEQDKVSDVSGSEDLEPVDVLLQFIPYYNQGDPANDSIVRSTLSNLSVEDIDSKDEYGNTLLLLACQYRCEDLVRIMLNKGADPNAVNTSGACCLHFACYRDSCSYNIAKILLTNGANPDIAETTYGCTPLHYCAGNGDINFCKLLLSYGAQLQTVDYYNYTCVDYAREAGFLDLVEFLQMRLDKVLAQQTIRSTAGLSTKNNGKTGSGGNAAANAQSSYDDITAWESHIDPGSGGKYFIHSKSGECLWESELKTRMQQHHATATAMMAAASIKAKPPAVTASVEFNESVLITQTTQTRLIAFLSKHDPTKLIEIDAMLTQYKGKEQELLNILCAKYNVPEDGEFKAFQAKLIELKNALLKPAAQGSYNNDSKETAVDSRADSKGEQQQQSSSSGKIAASAKESSVKASPSHNNNQQAMASNELVSGLARIDPLALHEFAQETKRKMEGIFDEEKATIKRKYDQALEEEKAAARLAISEKEGLIAKLLTQLDTLTKEKASLETDIDGLKARSVLLQSKGGEALSSLEKELQALQEENRQLKAQLAKLQQEVNYEKEKLSSLEVTMANLTSGKDEMIQRERQAAQERAEQQRLREEQHAKQLQDYESKAKNAVMKLKGDLNQAKNEWIRQEKDLKETLDTTKTKKEREIEELRRELAERKAQFAQEISSANMQVEDYKKLVEEAQARVQAAEIFQKMVQNEIAEAKVVQKYNAQLHKDLQREQLQRKKLHNEMEDLKGKIRVYVRIRPFSTSEKERGCTEAVIKDGKMSVIVKGVGGPEGKKIYDFDQVFAGMTINDGNTQADVFKDTKHLMMSVIDGFNVCIFAYGQTGAGKSYTMIGAADIATCISDQGDFDDQAGITPRAVAEIFRLLNERTAQVESVVEVQMFQLYRDGLEDLLKEKKKKKNGTNNKGNKGGGDDEDEKEVPLKITLAEHSPTGLVYVEGAETMSATTPVEVMKIFAKGSARRTTASTQMNSESSRSHLICALVVKLTNRRTGTISTGKLTLVDLAGSERVDKSGAMGEMLKEAQSINKSLSALGDVIAALTTNQSHVPYRNHPLTMLMSDSIGGNAKTLMFVNTSPADYNSAESNNSLAFASRCKDITNMVAGGGGPGVQAAQVNALKKELAKLKKGAAAGGGGGGAGGGGAKMPMGGMLGGAQLQRPDTAAQSRK